ncbi:MAG: hypothetical protein Q8P41_06610 [Pseudomonadota bacterium]|nr:hypothetical protein [Pseudomonadota bacterium]
MSALLAGLAAAMLGGTAQAAETAHYHPNDVAKKSTVFAKVAEDMGPAFDERQGRIVSLGTVLAELELGVALLGPAAPAEVRAWSEKTRRKVVGETLRLQRHVDLLQEDYGRVFGAAVSRALPVVGKGFDVKECGATGVLAMMGKKDCPGTDLNPKLAAAIDADAALGKELADIASVEWPTFEAPSAAQPVVALTGTTRWVSGGALAEKLIGGRVKLRQDALESQLDRSLPDEPTQEDLAKAQKLKDDYLLALGADGDVLRKALTEALARAEKKGGPAQVGWCANPPALGGCAGDDVTAAVLETVQADKKFAKGIAELTAD